MTNPILSMLGQQNAQPRNNQALPTSMDDPRMNNIKKYVDEHGGDPKAVFYQLCQEKMLNPANVINMILGQRR